MTRKEFFDLMEDEFCIQPDYPFKNDFDSAVWRHKDNRKWFALLMKVPKFRLGFESSEVVELLDVKCDPLLRGGLLQTKGVIPAYHMNKVHWISVLLDEIDEQNLKTILEMSFQLTKKTSNKNKNKTTKKA